ncbi:uncharacterized protein LOC112595640 [Melanaphis sacchari]|uniref:uncharacterized protein LOC112595640 n=1 Tax=Melanaphis sacchari TaxID=742174 RepID=UPI000DC1436A|nr:uncharacterized protein LOC112595640 [Melanaphis sacchari]
MGSKFEGFEECFKMTFKSCNSIALLHLRDMNENRTTLECKIAVGLVTKREIMDQLKHELHLFDTLLKRIEDKMNKMQCCKVINNVISILTKRINDLWNNIHLLFDVEGEHEPEVLDVEVDDFVISQCSNCNNCSITIKSIISSIEIISKKNDAVFNLSSSDFSKILQTTAFVDKTLMIKEVFQNNEVKGIVITAPHKYGKSTNLSMLKYFLEIQVDSLGKPITKANTGKPITDTSNYELFKNLKISKEVNIMNEHFGKYPVLYVNFKTENITNSYCSAAEKCKGSIHNSFSLHNYLQKSKKLSSEERKLCKLWSSDSSYKRIIFDEISTGLRILCKCLSKHYNKPCFVLIDELDALTITGTITDDLVQDYKNIFIFLKQLLLFLKNNKYVFQAFITGKSVSSIHGIVPSCIQILPFSNFHEFTDYFGFTTNELEYLFKKPEFKSVTTTIEEVKAYYGAYNKIDLSTKTKKQIYCMWSILNVLRRNKLDNYWRDFGKFFFNFSIPGIKTIMQKLLVNETFVVMLYNTTESKTHPTPPPIIETSENPFTKSSLDYFFNVLLDLGYMTFTSASILVLDVHNSTNSCIGYVKIPNEEIKQDIEHKISLLS